MRVKVGDRWYDSRTEPVCVQFSEEERLKIASWDWGVAPQGKFCVFPQSYVPNVVRAWAGEG